LTENDGAGEHHAGGLGRAHQTMFDWLGANPCGVILTRLTNKTDKEKR
jgi:hypothetical protein